MIPVNVKTEENEGKKKERRKKKIQETTNRMSNREDKRPTLRKETGVADGNPTCGRR